VIRPIGWEVVVEDQVHPEDREQETVCRRAAIRSSVPHRHGRVSLLSVESVR
jgi:hypothetical protein